MKGSSIFKFISLVGIIVFISIAPSPFKKIDHTVLAQRQENTVEQKTILPQAVVEPVQAAIVAEVPKVALEPEKPVGAPTVSPPAPTDCATEIKKYDWPQSAAYRVMMKESSNNPAIVNNNPRTGDYSIGCFQINLYGANARNRPSQAHLQMAANNVAYAYGLWKGKGGTFLRDWPNTCRVVGC